MRAVQGYVAACSDQTATAIAQAAFAADTLAVRTNMSAALAAISALRRACRPDHPRALPGRPHGAHRSNLLAFARPPARLFSLPPILSGPHEIPLVPCAADADHRRSDRPGSPRRRSAGPGRPCHPLRQLAPSLLAPTAGMLVGVQYPIELENCPLDTQTHSILTVHPKTGVTAFPVLWGTRQQVLFRADVAGTYDVSLYWPDSAGTVHEIEVSIVVAGGPCPVNPPPGPAPSPVPGPTKIADGHLWLMLVTQDLAVETPAEGAIRADPKIQAQLDLHKNQFRSIDVPTAPAAYAPWVTAARGIGLPVALLVDDRQPAGTLRDSLSLTTATPADVAALLKKWEDD